MDKIKVKNVRIVRGEGPVKLCGTEKFFSSLDDASKFLRSMSQTYPKLGYDKHDLRVEFEDGEIYSGRLDCKYWECENNNLNVREHILDFLKIHAGILRPGWMKNQQWESFCKRNRDEGIENDCKEMLEKYEI